MWFMTGITIPRPDDMHLHLRDRTYLHRTVADAARQFQRAIIMPNLPSPVTTIKQAEAYYQRIIACRGERTTFEPLMTLYLTDTTSAELIKAAAAHPHIYAVKLYPAGVTTHADRGVTRLSRLDATLEAMQKYKLPLLIHGEVVDPSVDIFDREARFIETQLIPLQKRFPQLNLILEHVSTSDAVDYVIANKSIAATITAHHLLYDRNSLFAAGINPHYYCLPILKRQSHRQALLKAATSGNAKFFLGTDSAPHTIKHKESGCGCAGIYSAYSALELYAEAFEKANALDKLAAFASHFGADFYGLPRNATQLSLAKINWQMPLTLAFGRQQLRPLKSGETLAWKLVASP